MRSPKTRQRKMGMYILAFLFVALAGAFFILGAYTSPSVEQFLAKVSGSKPTPQTEYQSLGTSSPFFLNSTMVVCTIQANFTLSGNELSVGQPVSLQVNMSIQEPITPYVFGVSVQLENTFQSERPYTQTIGLGSINESLGRRLWLGNGLFEFNTVGPLVVDITIYTLDKTGKVDTIDLGKNILSDIIIGLGVNEQAKYYEDQNLSLTLFILFFASIDIAATIYDHSYEDIDEAKNSAKDKHNQAHGDRYCPE